MIASDPAPPPGAPALAAAKAYLRIDDTQEDALLATLLGAAAGLCERFTGLALLARDVVETIPAAPCWRRLALAPVRTITAVRLLAPDGSASALDVDGYRIDIDANGDGWVRTIAAGTATRAAVAYATGLADDWGDLPDALRQGVVRLAAHLHAHRDAADDGGPPAAVAALWRPWRRMRLR